MLMDASFAATFLIIFRESLEAGLIIGIILTVLYRLQGQRYYPHVLGSVGLAVAVSLAIAWLLGVAAEKTRGDVERMMEGLVSVLACAVVTYMVFWMGRQARQIRSDIETRISWAIPRNDLYVMISLPFVAVFREGVETVLFLKAVAFQSSQSLSVGAGLMGLALAGIITGLIFLGGKRLPMKALFQWTGCLFIFIAAGLLAYGVHELEEIGWVHGIISPVWNINHILNEKEGVGAFLKALFGYNGNPSLVEVSLYALYLSLVFHFFSRVVRPRAAVPA